MSTHDEEIALSKPMRRAWLGEDERSVVYRSGDLVLRETGPWATTVHSLLNHLEAVGFAYSPRVVGSGFTADDRETLSFIEGETINPKQWSAEGAAAVGRMLRETMPRPLSDRHPTQYGRRGLVENSAVPIASSVIAT